MKQRTLFFVLVLLSTLTASAQTLINGLYYKNFDLSAKTCEVTKHPNKYTGSVTIPSSVTYRGSSYSVAAVGDSAFYKCSDLTSVSIPKTVTSIDSCAFEGCYGLKSITIPNSVTTIEFCAFYKCSGLTSVTIPNSVTSIGQSAFYSCSGLTSVTIPNSVTSIGKYAFSVCTGLTSVTIPNSVTSIGEYAFLLCSGLTSVTIPNSVTSIGGYAFSGCSGLTSVKIGSGVKSIGNYAFRNCSQLGHVYCYADDIPSTGTDVFENSSIEFVTLHVPSSLIEEYKVTEPWNGFGAFEVLPMPQCATPVIAVVDGKVTLSCETEGVEYDYTISTAHVKTSDEDVTMPDQLQITVYAYKDGYQRSNSATKTFDKSILVGTSGIRGDVNLDGEIGMPDVMFIVNYILNGKFPDE